MTRPAAPSRREFLKSTTVVAAGAVLAGGLSLTRSVHAAGSDVMKIALVGCGGRGSGAVADSLRADPNLRLIGVADAFEPDAKGALATLKKEFGDRIDVPAERIFVGLDAYQKAIDLKPDYIILATPPGFRPSHYAAAIKAGRNVFMEKPCCIDAGGYSSLVATNKLADENGQKVVVGLQRRHHQGYLRGMEEIHGGKLGKILFMRAYWNGSGIWIRKRADLAKRLGREPTEMEYQIYNWYHFCWLCGDNICEQHVHNLDVCNWANGDQHPVEANGMGGCILRYTGANKGVGQIFDEHFVEFTYADGTKLYSQCRQIPNTFESVSEAVHGTLGTSNAQGGVKLYTTEGGTGEAKKVLSAGSAKMVSQGTKAAARPPRSERERPGAHGPDRRHPQRREAQRGALRRHEQHDRGLGPAGDLLRQGRPLGRRRGQGNHPVPGQARLGRRSPRQARQGRQLPDSRARHLPGLIGKERTMRRSVAYVLAAALLIGTLGCSSKTPGPGETPAKGGPQASKAAKDQAAPVATALFVLRSDLDAIPADAAVVASVRLKAILESKLLEPIFAEPAVAQQIQQSPIDLRKIDTFTTILVPRRGEEKPGQRAFGSLTIFRFTEPTDAKEVFAKASLTPDAKFDMQVLNGMAYYRAAADTWFAQAGERAVAVANQQEVLHELLLHDTQPGADAKSPLAEKVQAAGATEVTIVAQSGAIRDLIKGVGLLVGQASSPAGGDSLALLNDVKSAALTVNLSDDTLAKLVLDCTSAESAKNTQEAAAGFLDVGKLLLAGLADETKKKLPANAPPGAADAIDVGVRLVNGLKTTQSGDQVVLIAPRPDGLEKLVSGRRRPDSPSDAADVRRADSVEERRRAGSPWPGAAVRIVVW